MDDYGLPAGYVSQRPARHVPVVGGPVWQPDVYPLAACLAVESGCSTLVDVGCGNAAKLLQLDSFELVGIDLPDALPLDRRDEATFVAHDLDTPGPLPVCERLLRDSVLICSDVIEHLWQPEYLVAALREALREAQLLVLSTPDRDRVRGPHDLGPPPNPCHVREWTASELVSWLTREGLHVVEQTWQRSNDHSDRAQTTVLVLSG